MLNAILSYPMGARHLEISEALEAIHSFMQTEEASNGYLNNFAPYVRQELKALGGLAVDSIDAPLASITGPSWAESIDTSKPTIGLRTNVPVAGNVILAAAAQRLRSRGEDTCNVVLLPPVSFSQEALHRKVYVAQRGIIISPGDNVWGGAFPEALGIDALPSSAFADDPKINKIMRFVNASALESMVHDKSRVHKVLESTTIPRANVIAADIEADSPALIEEIKAAFKQNTPIVIKPASSERGEGVVMLDPATTELEAAIESVRAQYPERRKLLVETWLQSIPLHHAKTGVRQDWNVRAVVMGGELAGAYARVGTYGNAVNLATGAFAASLEEVLEKCGLSEDEKSLVKTRLRVLAKQIYQAIPANCMGADIIITKDLQPRLVEINGEYSGGLYNSMLAGQTAPTWEPAYVALKALQTSLFGHRRHRRHKPRLGNMKGVSAIDGRDLLDSLYDSPFLLDEHTQAQLLPHLKIIRQKSPGLEPEADRCIRFIKQHRSEKLEQIGKFARYDTGAHLRMFAGYFRENKMAEAFDQLDAYIATAPDNIKVLHSAASALEMSLINTKGSNDSLFGHGPLDEQSAVSYARATFFVAVREARLDLQAYSKQTQANILSAIGNHFTNWPYKGPLIFLDDIEMTRAERDYLRPLERYINGRQAFNGNDAATLNAILVEGIEDPKQADQALTDIIMKRLAQEDKKENVRDIDTTTLGLVVLSQGNLHLTFRAFSRDMQGELFSRAFQAFCNRELQTANASITEQEGNAILNALLGSYLAYEQGDIDEAAHRLHYFERLTGRFEQPPFNVSYQDIAKQLADMQESIAELEE